MSEDLLNQATRALRQSTDDGQAGPAAARMHILARAQHQRVRGERRAAVAMALSAVLVTSTAIAAASGALPGVIAAVQRAVGMEASEPTGSGQPLKDKAEAAARSRSKQGKGPVELRPVAPAAAPQVADLAVNEPLEPANGAAVAPAAEPPAPVSPAPASPVSAPPAQAGAGGSESEGQPAVAARRQPAPAAKPQLKALKTAAEPAVNQPAAAAGPQATGAAQATAAAQAEPVVVAAPTAPPDAPPDETLVLFRAAQALQHRDKNYAKALAAWEGYLHAAPAGALAPEARWNRAICLLRLGRKPQARIALEHFAHGAEGGYRQAEATKLLAALEGSEP